MIIRRTRILSVMLAILMTLSIMPFSALTARAESYNIDWNNARNIEWLEHSNATGEGTAECNFWANQREATGDCAVGACVGLSSPNGWSYNFTPYGVEKNMEFYGWVNIYGHMYNDPSYGSDSRMEDWAVLLAMTLTNRNSIQHLSFSKGGNSYSWNGFVQPGFAPPISDNALCALVIAYCEGWLQIDPSSGFTCLDTNNTARIRNFFVRGYGINREIMHAIACIDQVMHYKLTGELLSLQEIAEVYADEYISLIGLCAKADENVPKLQLLYEKFTEKDETMERVLQMPELTLLSANMNCATSQFKPALAVAYESGVRNNDYTDFGRMLGEAAKDIMFDGLGLGDTTTVSISPETAEFMHAHGIARFPESSQSDTASNHRIGAARAISPDVFDEPINPPDIWLVEGYIDVHKAAEDQDVNSADITIGGIEFRAVNVDSGQEYSVVTDNDGFAHFKVLPGTYRVYEVTPAKYQSTVEVPYDTTGIVVYGGQTVDIYPTNKLVMGGIQLDKYDANFSNETVPEGDATFNQTGFYVKNISGWTIKYRDAAGERWIQNGNYVVDSAGSPVIFYTDASGHMQTSDRAFTYGQYQLTEVVKPIGYDLNSAWSTNVTLNTDLVTVYVDYNNRILESPSLSGDITVQKFDSDMYNVPYNRGDEVSNGKPQGDATLAGAEIEVYNKSQRKIWYNGRAVAPDGLVDTIVTNDKGVALITGLVYGTYLFIEKSPPTGYLKNSTWQQTLVQHEATGTRFHIGTNGATKDKSVRDDVIRAKVTIDKYDYEVGDKDPLGDAGGTTKTLAGAQIQCINRSLHEIYYNGPNGDNRWVPVGAVVDVYITDENGYCETPDYALPYGTYEFLEIKAPTGYNVRTEWHPIVEVREHGHKYELKGPQTGLYDKVMRGDLKFDKTDAATQERLENVAFRITSLTTGESHIVVTDANGVFDSTIFPNQQATGYGGGQNQAGPQADAYNLALINSNDNAVYSDGSVNVAALNPYAGVWFTGDADGTNPAKEGLRPFPYDTYEVEELRCESNADKVLVKFTITVNAQSQLIDRGSVDDVFPEIRTMLLDQDTQDHVASARADIVLVDQVTYTNLYPGNTYYLKGILMDQETGIPIEIDGSPITGQTSFVAEGTEGVVNLEFMLSTQTLQNKTVVAFVTLYDEASMTVPRYESVDINNEDETVHFPTISTTLTGEHGEKEVVSSESCILIDTVQFTNLIPNQTDVMHADLRDKNTGQIVLSGDGALLEREVTFKPTTPNGTVEVPFLFDSSLCEGRTLVCFESLTRNTVPVAEHKDLDDVEQTVTIPSISTTLWDEDGNHVVYAADVIKLVDTVEYHALQIGKEYIMKGTLIDKQTGKPLQNIDGSDITAEQSFTPDANDGTVDVIFEFPGEIGEGKTLEPARYHGSKARRY